MTRTDTLEFHDSEVSSLGLEGPHFVVRFSAGHVYRADEHPGPGGSAGFLQSLELVCLNPSEVQQDAGCIGKLLQGGLHVAGATLGRVPIPYAAEAKVELELAFSNGATCRVVAHGVVLKPRGEARFVESFKC